MRISTSAPGKILFTRGNPKAPLPAADLKALDLNDVDDQELHHQRDELLEEIEKEKQKDLLHERE